ncbi:hypothetical protein HK100_011677 [Physocladia obscura]|uniref:Uncharacterized protein n=1 Tax=Physocladia obscura TaxID=109957 RepID=A0AAD5T0Y7_9FUNG|nr:hypothetical protein HK100_011677 [Physocladia obscura]
MQLPRSIPKRMPPASVLRHLAFPPPPEHLRSTMTRDGFEKRPPRIPERMQARVRKAAVLAGLDPDLFIPPTPSDSRFKKPAATVPATTFAAQISTTTAPAKRTKLPVIKIPKGNSNLIKQEERKMKIKENMAKMAHIIKADKDEKAKTKLSKRPDIFSA